MRNRIIFNPRMKRRFLFIINPITGKYKVDRLRHACALHLDNSRFEWEVYQTQASGDAARKSFASRDDYDVIVAVGGDGTVNEVAQGLMGHTTPMGIIPNGSGNGLARHLTYSMNINTAMTQLIKSQKTAIDILRVNGVPCFNIAGVGFDAHVAHLFQATKSRGLLNYVWISAKEFLRYDYPSLKITTDTDSYECERAFSLTLANASQLGNNAVVAKDADLSDGLMDLCLIKKYGVWYLPIATVRLFTQSLHRSRYFSGGKSSKVIVEVPVLKEVAVQIDGEPVLTANPVTFEIDPLALHVLIPEK